MGISRWILAVNCDNDSHYKSITKQYFFLRLILKICFLLCDNYHIHIVYLVYLSGTGSSAGSIELLDWTTDS